MVAAKVPAVPTLQTTRLVVLPAIHTCTTPTHSNPALTTSYLNHFCENILTPYNLSVIAKKNENGSFRGSILRLRDAMLGLVSRQSFIMFLLGVAFSLTSLFAVQNILHAYQ
jgi:hypothetical protein